MNNRDMQKVLLHLRKDPVVKAVYDAKSEEIGPNIFRFKAEIGQHSVQCLSTPRYLPCAVCLLQSWGASWKAWSQV